MLPRSVATLIDVLVQLKRYSIAKVYRKNPVGAGHPRELYECDYDIVSPPAMRIVHDAEVMKVPRSSLVALKWKKKKSPSIDIVGRW